MTVYGEDSEARRHEIEQALEHLEAARELLEPHMTPYFQAYGYPQLVGREAYLGGNFLVDLMREMLDEGGEEEDG